MNEMTNPYKEIDEFKISRESFNKFTIQSSLLFNNYISTIDNTKKIQINDLLLTTRISFNDEKINMKAPRKVLTIKRKK